MEINRHEELEFEFMGSGLPRTKAEDTGLIHASDVIRYIEWKLELGFINKNNSWDLNTAGELGFCWEDALEMAMKERYGNRVGEVEKDGVVGSPDAINLDPLGVYPMVDEEYKLTWKSMDPKSGKHPIADNWYYITQFMTYCTMMGVTCTMVYIYFVMGDYRQSGPRMRTYRCEFEQEELDENWDMIVTHANEMREKEIWRAPR